jgi:hypothetical protein
MVMNTWRPPRSDPAVSKTAPDWSASRFRKSAWSSFCSGGVAGADHAQRLGLPGERVGPYGGEPRHVDHVCGVLGDVDRGQRHLADVPTAQVSERHRLLGGERLAAHGRAETVPRVVAGEDRRRLLAVGLDLVGHLRTPPARS